MTVSLTGLTALTGQRAVPWAHLPRVCPLPAAGPPPRRACFLDCSPDCPGERHRVVSIFQTVTHRSESSRPAPMWRGVLCRAWGSSPREQTYYLRLTGSLHGHTVGSGRPLGPLASLLPCYKPPTSCFVPGKPQLDPRGMCHVPQHKDIAPSEEDALT